MLCSLACFVRWAHKIGNQVSDSDGAGSDTASYQGLVQISGKPVQPVATRKRVLRAAALAGLATKCQILIDIVLEKPPVKI